MSDKNLRAAVEKLEADWRSLPHDPDSTATTVLRHCGAQLAAALAEHPAEPAPALLEEHRCTNLSQHKAHTWAWEGSAYVCDGGGIPVRGIAEGGGITDAAIEVTAAALWDEVWSEGKSYSQASEAEKDECRSSTRTILEAAYPLLGLQQVPRPLLDREAVRGHLVSLSNWASPEGHVDEATDAVMDLARPMPTHALVDGWLSDHEKVWHGELGDRCACGWRPDSWETEDEFDEYYREHRTAAVLALLNGTPADPPV